MRDKKRNSYSEKNERNLIYSWILQITIFLVLIVLISSLISIVGKIQGTSRVINYVGFVRGGTQRLVKLEISGEDSSKMQEELGIILYSLIFGSEKLDIIKIDDQVYSEKLDELVLKWGELGDELLKVRLEGYENSNIVEVSEEYFLLSDEASDAVENYVYKLEKKLLIVEILLLTYIIFFVIYLIYKTFDSVKLINSNKEITKKAYIDMHTGLANKSKCNEVLGDNSILSAPTCFIMLDLNHLKKVNDTLGHIAGDTLILNFANILRDTIGKNGFIGRFGGDEFIAIITDVTQLDIDLILDELATEVSKYNNDSSHNLPISYACGYSFSTEYKECSLQTLLDKADHNMYINKHAFKGVQDMSENGYYIDEF